MENQEAIKWQNVFKKYYSGITLQGKIACDMAIVALKMRTPQKPKIRECGVSLISKMQFCPNCGKKLYDCAIKNGKIDHVSRGSKKSKFCEDCGQAINWGNKNNG